ncbi:hypothetical protein FRC12_018992 [Ceratobasidium sp. 428]|nr:hypothetical protein FRC12_018992 [Ceratobasidium sp. 428]
MHISAFTIPRPTSTSRPGFYSACARTERVSTLYPNGRKSVTPDPPLASNDIKPKRKKLNGLLKGMSRLFRKGKKDKPKGPSTLAPDSQLSATELRTSNMMFDTSEELDGAGYKASVESGSGSEPANALSELIDAHSDSNIGFNLVSDSELRSYILAKFPPLPTTPLPPDPLAGLFASDSSLTITEIAVPNQIPASESLSSQSSLLNTYTRQRVSPSQQFFKQRPDRREHDHGSVFRSELDVIQARRLQPRPLSGKTKVEVSSRASSGPIKMAQVHVPVRSPVPYLIVTTYESTKVVSRLGDPEYQDSEPIEPGLLFPEYIREYYPTPRQFTVLPRLTLSTSDWNLILATIARDEENKQEEGCLSRFSDSHSNPDFTSGNDTAFGSSGQSTSSNKVDDRSNALGAAL